MQLITVFLHLFALLGPGASATIVLSQAIDSLSIKQLDGTNKASTGTTVALVTARVAIVHMGANKTLLIAQQDHDLEWDENKCMLKITHPHTHSHTQINACELTCSHDMLRW